MVVLGMISLMCLVTQSFLTLCNTMDCSLSGFSVHGDSPGKSTRVGCHALLQGIFLNKGLNPGLPHGRWILYYLSHQGSLMSLISSVTQSGLTLVTPWTAACQASLSITNSWSLLKLMSIALVMPSNHLILC